MNPPRRAPLAARIAEVAGQALSTRQVVTPIEVLTGIGWLPAAQVESWRRGRVLYLERVAGANLAKLNTALRLLADWARHHGLTPSETVYVTWTQDRRRLRLTKTGDDHVERAWRTHWISPALTEAKRARRIRQRTTAPDMPVLPHPAHTTEAISRAAPRPGEAPCLPAHTANLPYG
jgi:hypothetical protein